MQATCLECGYGATGLLVGDARHDIAACNHCRAVVNPVYSPFRPLEPVCCPVCQVVLAPEAFFFSRLPGPMFPCPRCGEPRLGLTTRTHFSMRMPDPEMGELVHARTLGAGTAVLAGRLWPISGEAETLSWVEATVGEKTLQYQRFLQPWGAVRQRFVRLEVPPERIPWLRTDLAGVVSRFTVDAAPAWLDYQLLAEPHEGEVLHDEEQSSLVVRLPYRRDELESYLTYLAERFEDCGGQFWHQGEWVSARLVVQPNACELRDPTGVCLDRLEFPAPPPPPPPPPPPEPISADECRQKAGALLAEGRPQEAAEALRQLLRSDSSQLKDGATLELMFRALVAASDFKDAWLVFSKLESLRKVTGELCEFQADLLAGQELWRETLRTLKKGADLYDEQARKDDSQRCWDRMIALCREHDLMLE